MLVQTAGSGSHCGNESDEQRGGNGGKPRTGEDAQIERLIAPIVHWTSE